MSRNCTVVTLCDGDHLFSGKNVLFLRQGVVPSIGKWCDPRPFPAFGFYLSEADEKCVEIVTFPRLFVSPY